MRISRFMDAAGLGVVSLVLMTAFYFQLRHREFPCAMCNLQRAGFLVFGAGLMLNLRERQARGLNYLLAGLGALIGSLVGLGQMFIHAPPGTPPLGSPILGIHLYFAVYIALTLAGVYCLAMAATIDMMNARRPWKLWLPDLSRVMIGLFVVMAAANLTSVVLQYGFGKMRGGGQQHYELLHDGDIMKP